MKIIQYDNKYRDDMIFMVLQAKDALGRKPGLNEDLLTIEKSYINVGDMFWLAIDDADRVIGCIGFSSIPETTEAFIHRLFVKADKKHCGIGSMLLKTAEDYMRNEGKTIARVHLGAPKEQWFESYSFYPKYGYTEYEERFMEKHL